MAPRLVPSAHRHGLGLPEALHVIEHRWYFRQGAGRRDGSWLEVYVGPWLGHPGRDVELLIRFRPGEESAIFHLMPFRGRPPTLEES